MTDPIQEARRLAAAEVHDGDFELALCEWANGDGLLALLKAARLTPAEYDEDGGVVVLPVPQRAPLMYGIGSSYWNGLAKLNEEAGELIQILGKLLATGGTDHWEGDLRPRLVEELGDLRAAIDFFATSCLRPDELDAVVARTEAKIDLFERWEAEQRHG